MHDVAENSLTGTDLQLLQGHFLFTIVLSDEETVWLYTRSIVLHVQCDGSPGLGTSTNMVELEPHESLDQSCSMIHYHDNNLQLWKQLYNKAHKQIEEHANDATSTNLTCHQSGVQQQG